MKSEKYYTARIENKFYLGQKEKFDVVFIQLAKWFDSKDKLFETLQKIVISGKENFDKLEIVEIDLSFQKVKVNELEKGL